MGVSSFTLVLPNWPQNVNDSKAVRRQLNVVYGIFTLPSACYITLLLCSLLPPGLL